MKQIPHKTFNIYCDESCHLENDHKNFMFLGCISTPYNQVKLHSQKIKDIKKKHHFYAEIKWTSVSKSKLRFYDELITYFFASELKFRAIGIKKSNINNAAFRQTYDDFYYKMYYQLLNHKINSTYKYNVYLDIKDTLSANKVNKLKTILNTQYGVFNNIQNIRSHESVLLQLTDFITGAISYSNNNENTLNQTKIYIIDKIKKHSVINNLSSTNYSDKLNLFFIELNYAS